VQEPSTPPNRPGMPQTPHTASLNSAHNTYPRL